MSGPDSVPGARGPHRWQCPAALATVSLSLSQPSPRVTRAGTVGRLAHRDTRADDTVHSADWDAQRTVAASLLVKLLTNLGVTPEGLRNVRT